MGFKEVSFLLRKLYSYLLFIIYFNDDKSLLIEDSRKLLHHNVENMLVFQKIEKQNYPSTFKTF